MANWSDMPEDIIAQFQERLDHVEDFVVFGAICKRWRIAAIQNKNKKLGPFAPLLMLAKRENDTMSSDDVDEEKVVRTFLSPTRNKCFSQPLPQAQGRRCWGSIYGWFITVGLDLNIHLLNPLSRTQIALPPQPTLQSQSKRKPNLGDLEPMHICQAFVCKFILASNPSFWTNQPQECCVMLALYGPYQELAYATPLDETWTRIEVDYPRIHQDAIYFNNKFYVVSNTGKLGVCELSSGDPKVIDIIEAPDCFHSMDTFYLMEISGDLHVIARAFKSDKGTCRDDYHYVTYSFEVFKFDFAAEEYIEVEDFNDHALFVGNNASFAISTMDYPEFKKNCIYFTDDHFVLYKHRFCDMGIYNYMTYTVEKQEVGDDLLSEFSRPAFFMPSL